MAHFREHDGLKYHFEQRFLGEEKCEEDIPMEFPIHKENLVKQYIYVEQMLNDQWHKDVNLGAAITGDGLLTDHGVEHVNDVMMHANMIIGKNVKKLIGYEIYLLLLAIHFHDLGNIKGREEHEEKIAEIMAEMGEALPLDITEKQFVIAIATAHGGYVNGDKDTIYNINVDRSCNGIKVRAKLLAAILRFADELSDDFNRAKYKGIDIPTQNEAFHEYSKSLEPVLIEGETVAFHFRIPHALTQKKIGKANRKVFLYDEILERLAKTMRELEYCRNYGEGIIKLTTSNVTIDVSEPNNILKCKESLGFRLRVQGYPNKAQKKIENYLDYASPEEAQHNEKSEIKYGSGSELKKAMKGGGKNAT